MDSIVSSPDGRPLPPSKLRSFSRATLNDNWYEDRWYKQEEDNDVTRGRHKINAPSPDYSIPVSQSNSGYPLAPTCHLSRICEGASTKCIPFDFPQSQQQEYYKTTNQTKSSLLFSKLNPQPTKTLLNSKNLTQTLSVDRSTVKPETGFGATLPKHLKSEHQQLFETTNEFFYGSNLEGKQEDVDRTFFAKGTIKKDIWDDRQVSGNLCGRAGTMGEISRHPGESGSVYGMSVFVDEYSKWGSKLQGYNLQQTVGRMQTQYF